MKKSTKAALLSGLLLPGAGHIYLKKYIFGFVLAGVVLTGMYYLISKATETAFQIVEQMQNGSIPLDAATITELASAQPVGTEATLQNIATAAIIVCWIIGVIDSYRIGAMQDKAR